MTDVPSLAIGVHDRYSPEIRDRIFMKLQEASRERAYRVLTPSQLRSLADIDAPHAPVLSLYLQLGPERRVGGAWRVAFKDLEASVLEPLADRHRREVLRAEFSEIEQALEAELPALGRGAAFFVGRRLGLWQQFALSLPLPDAVHVAPRPYLRPLLRARDEHDRFMLALVSQELSRFLVTQIGTIEEVFQVKGERVRRMLGHRGPVDGRDSAMREGMKNEARVVAHALDLALAQFESRHLLLSGEPELRRAVTDYLPKDIERRAGIDTFSVELHARPSEIAEAAEPTQRKIEEHEEVATVRRLLDSGPKGSAWGEAPVLEALRYSRVATLVVDDMYTTPGARCGNCGALLTTATTKCPVCGSESVIAVEDVVELAIEEALEERAELEIVRSGAARNLLSGIGPLAALLRW